MRSGIILQRLLAAMLILSMIVTLVGGLIVGRISGPTEADLYTEDPLKLVAHYSFDGEDPWADSSGYEKSNGAKAELKQQTQLSELISTNYTNSFLDLTDSDAYLSLPAKFLEGKDEFTLEMRVYTTVNNNPNWAFFAAPNGNPPRDNNEHYLGVLLNSQIKVERYAMNNAGRPYSPISEWTAGVWHTVKVVFETNSTSVYIDDMQTYKAQQLSAYQIKDCISTEKSTDDGKFNDYTDSVIYFGHATWGSGEGFNGYIDDIKFTDNSGNILASFDFEGSGDEILSDSYNNTLTVIPPADKTPSGGTTDETPSDDAADEPQSDDVTDEPTSDDTPDETPSEGTPEDILAKIIKTEGDTANVGGFLNLNGKDIYFSLPGSLLQGYNKASVEMKALTSNNNANWAFFAAPTDNAVLDPRDIGREHYLGVLLNDKITAERYANTGDRPASPSAPWSFNQWHDIKILFDEERTTIYIDGAEAASETSGYSLQDCISDNGDYSNSILCFGHAFWNYGESFNGYIDDIRITGINGSGENELAYFDFESNNNDINERFANKSGNIDPAAQKLKAHKLDCIVSETVNGSREGYLDLSAYGLGNSGENAYLSIPTDYFIDELIDEPEKEMTIEMRIRNKAAGSNWAFFAAPDDSAVRNPENIGYEKYLGVLLNNGITVERYANEGKRAPSINVFPWGYDDWHTIRIVFAEKSTRLYIDGNMYGEEASGYSLKDCITKDGNHSKTVFCFGHAFWNEGEGFNGCIDDIRIWIGAKDENDPKHGIYDPYIDPSVEEQYIITDHVVDPPETTVNMFDYWITGQTDNDYRPNHATGIGAYIMPKGINAGHRFLFIGYDASKYTYPTLPLEPQIPGGSPDLGLYIDGIYHVGSWNVSGHNTGIVENRLYDGYPKLSGNEKASAIFRPALHQKV